MRLDSPFVLAIAGTLAIHTLLVVAVDAVVVSFPYRPAPPAPRVDLVDVEVPEPPEPPKPPPPPVAQPEVKPAPAPTPREPRPQPRVAKRSAEPPPQASEPPPPEAPAQDDSPGGDEVMTLADVPPGATGVAVKVGKRTTGHVGRGGQGGGTGAGSGSGAADAPAPVSVATIKTRAMPRGDYGYFADYPLEAKQLGIEGDIRVRLVVDDTGKVKQAVLLNRLGHGLDQLALSRARQIEFDPAKDTDGKPVASVVVWTFHMTLPK